MLVLLAAASARGIAASTLLLTALQPAATAACDSSCLIQCPGSRGELKRALGSRVSRVAAYAGRELRRRERVPGRRGAVSGVCR